MSTISVKTRAWNDIELIRHARPYRMAVIELICAVAGQNPTYRVVFSEFGQNVCTSAIRTANTGTYNVGIAAGVFKNTSNVSINTTITYNATTTGAPATYTEMYVSGYFDSSANPAYTNIRIVTAAAPGTTNTDLVGKMLVVLKEYYYG